MSANPVICCITIRGERKIANRVPPSQQSFLKALRARFYVDEGNKSILVKLQIRENVSVALMPEIPRSVSTADLRRPTWITNPGTWTEDLGHGQSYRRGTLRGAKEWAVICNTRIFRGNAVESKGHAPESSINIGVPSLSIDLRSTASSRYPKFSRALESIAKQEPPASCRLDRQDSRHQDPRAEQRPRTTKEQSESRNPECRPKDEDASRGRWWGERERDVDDEHPSASIATHWPINQPTCIGV
ncbi:hypothetical protein FB451DRAFT_1371185 [Mycena latifolia]|nr:hypothetical protein FB451DRAFT_1371185 [Mycena latifolia]